MVVEKKKVAHEELVGSGQTALHSHAGGGGANIKSGIVYLAAAGESAVTFNTPFASVPRVVAIQQFATTDTSTTLSIHSVTVNGFTLKGAGNVAGDVAWVATDAGNP